MNDPTIYAALITQLHDQIRHHEREARKARVALGAIKDLLGGIDPTRAKPRGGSGISRRELGERNRLAIAAYFKENPKASMWMASKALELSYAPPEDDDR
jgi:hypothetical protein